LEKMKLQNLQLGDPVRQPRYEPGTSWTKVSTIVVTKLFMTKFYKG
jgi:hypothetical protein